MKRVWGHLLATASLLSGAATLFSACVHDNSTLFIRNVLAQQYQQGGVCAGYMATEMQPFTPSGVLDVSLRTQYDAVFLVGNQIVAQANADQLRTETSIVTIQGAIVRITDAGGTQLNTFTRLTSATIDPSTGSTASFEPVAVTIVDPGTINNDQEIARNVTAAALGGAGYVRLVTYTRFFGQTLGGQSVESDEFEFPVDVCNGCLINFSNAPQIDSVPAVAPNCLVDPATSSGASATTPLIPCIVGEDLPVDCAGCSGQFESCRGAYPNGFSSGGVDAGAG